MSVLIALPARVHLEAVWSASRRCGSTGSARIERAWTKLKDTLSRSVGISESGQVARTLDMATEQAIREQTRKTLSEANLDGTSARTIKSLVGQALEIPKEELRGFHPLIEVSESTCIVEDPHIRRPPQDTSNPPQHNL